MQHSESSEVSSCISNAINKKLCHYVINTLKQNSKVSRIVLCPFPMMQQRNIHRQMFANCIQLSCIYSACTTAVQCLQWVCNVVTINSRFLHHSCIIMSAYTHAECLKCMSLCTPTSLRALRIFLRKTQSLAWVQSDLNALKEMTGQVTSIHQTYMYIQCDTTSEWLIHTPYMKSGTLLDAYTCEEFECNVLHKGLNIYTHVHMNGIVFHDDKSIIMQHIILVILFHSVK